MKKGKINKLALSRTTIAEIKTTQKLEIKGGWKWGSANDNSCYKCQFN